MRKVTKILIAFVLSLFLCVSLFAQIKIAVVDSNTFYDEKLGIKELVVANKKLEEEFKGESEEIRLLNLKLNKLTIHLENHSFVEYRESKQKSNDEVSEFQNLSIKLKSLVEELNPRIKKRRNELVEPIKKRIAEKAGIFMKKQNHLILDKSKLDDSCFFIYDGEYIDITNEFIKFCNEEFEKEKARK